MAQQGGSPTKQNRRQPKNIPNMCAHMERLTSVYLVVISSNKPAAALDILEQISTVSLAYPPKTFRLFKGEVADVALEEAGEPSP